MAPLHRRNAMANTRFTKGLTRRGTGIHWLRFYRNLIIQESELWSAQTSDGLPRGRQTLIPIAKECVIGVGGAESRFKPELSANFLRAFAPHVYCITQLSLSEGDRSATWATNYATKRHTAVQDLL